MKVGIIGGGSWGTTLAQVLSDNGHEVLIYDINQSYIDKINNSRHPLFDVLLPGNIKASNNLKDVVLYGKFIMLSVPTKVMRDTLKEINKLIIDKKVFINVSKGIEPETLKRVGEIVLEEIDEEKLMGYVVLTGPSHAEEVILRKLTALVSASFSNKLAKEVQILFANDKYMRVYTSKDLIGCEVGGAVKNAIAVVSGISTGLGLGENARAALITRGIVEIVKVVKIMGGKEKTAFGLTGIGDLIVTASSENSRNFQAGKRIGEGVPLEKVFEEAKMTIEGVRTITAVHNLSISKNIELPIINAAYEVLFNNLSALDAISKLLSRDLKEE